MDKLGKKTSDYVEFNNFNDEDKAMALYDHASGAPKSNLEGVNDCCEPMTALCCPSLSFLNGIIFGCHPMLASPLYVGCVGNR